MALVVGVKGLGRNVFIGGREGGGWVGSRGLYGCRGRAWTKVPSGTWVGVVGIGVLVVGDCRCPNFVGAGKDMGACRLLRSLRCRGVFRMRHGEDVWIGA